MKSSTTNVETSNVEIPSNEEEVFHESSESFLEESSSSSLNDDVHQILEEVVVPSSNTQSVSNNMVPNVDEASTSHNVFNEHLADALETVRFGNNDFAVIAGYEDVVIGSMMIKKVYYVKGIGHNLFSVGKFYDKGVEVAFRKSTCFVRTKDGVDLLTGDR
nr:integrase, catalytic region, zinc finger, CCHC-type, peptidase aspartic, catalytic [Tanacetum cinerariifolium]